MFIGREWELASLNEFYDKDGIGLTGVYGRRRIGRSTRIAEFVKDKKVVKPLLHSFMGPVFEEMCRYDIFMKGITGEYSRLVHG